ncbi:MAG: DsbA family oxidoreductase [Candidatus Nanopelagicales bacterium]
MNIEIWSDVVCPWCFIGKRRLERALESAGVRDAVITHRAFQLDPSASTEGRRTVDVLAAKYGLDDAGVKQMMGQVTEVAAGEGLNYRLLDGISGNTVLAHRLLLWAQEQGRAQELLELLYSAYFENAKPVFTLDELLPYVTEAGLDPSAARIAMDSGAYDEEVKADAELARAFGANGVPFFVFDRKYGISGAQPFEVFVQTIEKALEITE